MDLDELLDSSAPPIAPRTAALERELHRMVLEAESAARPRRRRLRVGLTSALATVVIGAVGAGGAIATGLLPTPPWLPWTTPSGSSCVMQFTVNAVDSGNGEPAARGHTVAQQQRAVAEANRFLRSFDYSSIDQAAAIRKYQKAEEAAIAAQPDPAERPPRLTGDDLTLSAVGVEVWERLKAHLIAKRLEPHAVSFMSGWGCGE